jgi:hypothetical protein
MLNQIEYREGYTPSLKDPERNLYLEKDGVTDQNCLLTKQRGVLPAGWVILYPGLAAVPAAK